jgi:hypothetical protein
MAGAGSAWIKPKRRKDMRATGDYGPPPHPLRLRVGMRLWPRRAKRKVPITLTRIGPGDSVAGEREDPNRTRVSLSATRLLAHDQHRGIHYAFAGFQPRPRGYRTTAHVIGLDGDRLWLNLPEWHPRRAVTVPAATIAPGLQQCGRLLRCRADLSAPTPGALNLHDFRDPQPSDLEGLHLPGPVDHRPTTPPEATAAGPGCGEIVIAVTEAEWAALNDALGHHSLYRTRDLPPPQLAGIFVAVDDQVRGYAEPIACTATPMGYHLRLGAIELLTRRRKIQPADQASRAMWQWRWWPRTD